MQILYIILLVILIVIGVLMIRHPKKSLYYEHLFTVKRGTQYTEFAIARTILSGYIVVIASAVYLIKLITEM